MNALRHFGRALGISRCPCKVSSAWNYRSDICISQEVLLARNDGTICYFCKMKTKECPSCAMQVDAKSKLCPICQYEFTQTNRTWQVVALLLVLLFIYLILF